MSRKVNQTHMDEFKKGKKHTPDGQDVPQPYRYQLKPKTAKVDKKAFDSNFS
jgi:hypothetical protein